MLYVNDYLLNIFNLLSIKYLLVNLYTVIILIEEKAKIGNLGKMNS